MLQEYTPEAENDLKAILEYYYFIVQSKSYANRLNDIFENEIEVIRIHPKIGKPCNSNNVRAKIIGQHQIVYENTDSIIYILRIWDSRQNPSKLSLKHTKK